ncbi:MAG: hypothetical protein ACR2PR_09580 [Pseudohongiellaceae bacterium]
MNTHALSREDLEQELDKRNYVTQDQLVALTAQLDTKFANLKTEMAEMKVEMGQRMTNTAIWSVGVMGSFIGLSHFLG